MKVDIVCPLYNAQCFIDGFIKNLKAQQGIELGNVVFPVTRSEGHEEVVKKVSEAGFISFLVEPENFSHSLTREEAVYKYCTCDVVVMLSQDVVINDVNAINKLASVIDDKVVFAYGRQVCTNSTIEKYIRDKNYGNSSYVISCNDVQKLQLKSFFSSDAFSAYYRPAFISLGGYDHIPMMMNEDMYYSKKVLDSGYLKAYVAEAVVEHSHRFTLKQLYSRYYETGKWLARFSEFNEYGTTDSGFKLAFYILKRAIKDFNVPVLFRWLPDMAVRFIGLKAGKRHKEK